MTIKIDIVGDRPDAPVWWQGFMNEIERIGGLDSDYPECVGDINAALTQHNAVCYTTDACNGYIEFENEIDFVAFKLRFGI